MLSVCIFIFRVDGKKEQLVLDALTHNKVALPHLATCMQIVQRDLQQLNTDRHGSTRRFEVAAEHSLRKSTAKSGMPASDAGYKYGRISAYRHHTTIFCQVSP